MNRELRYYLLASLLVAVAGGGLFLSGLPGEFVFDDIPNIVNNKLIHIQQLDIATLSQVISSQQLSGYGRALPMLTFALDYFRAGGAEPAAFKATNILIHALTACALAWFFRSLLLAANTDQRRASWLGPALALAWAAHPLQVSSVLYVVQRLQTMGTLFLLLALMSYLQARQSQIQGRFGRPWFLATALLWAFALGCKEDSVLLPVYTLALELTVLRFGARSVRISSNLRRGYAFATVVAIAVFLFWAVPYFWHWDDYPGRDFSTADRLLTQPRVICMYLWQIVLPLPQHMPFYYDWIQPSRSLLDPWTTLPAMALIMALLASAWRARQSHPLFAFGVFIYFGAHLITSNVVGLELAFEHRNHFALVGAVLALGALVVLIFDRLSAPSGIKKAAGIAILMTLGTATLIRAHSWSSNLSLAAAATKAAPGSPRAWVDLCDNTFNAGGGINNPSNPKLDDAIKACSTGADSNPETLNSLALLVALKTIRGDVSPADWDRFQRRLNIAFMTPDNARAPLILSYYASLGVRVDKKQLLQALATLNRRVSLDPSTLSIIGSSIMNDLGEPESAMPYFLKAIQGIPAGDPYVASLAEELRGKNRNDLAEVILRADQAPSVNPSQ